MGPSCRRQQNLSHSMRWILATAANPPILMDKSEEGGIVWAHLTTLPSSPLPSPPPLHPESRTESERRKQERTLAIVELASPHSPAVRSDVGYSGAVAVGEVHRHQLHLVSGGLRRRLRGVSGDQSALGSMDPPISQRALRRERAGPAKEVCSCRRPHASCARV